MENQTCSDRWPRPRFAVCRIVGLTIGGMALAILFALLFGWLVQLLWNWLMPALFSLKSISYWQAFGIVLLAKILFGGCGTRHGNSYHRHFRQWRHHHKHWDHEDDGNGEDTWKPRGSYKNWKYYDHYWRDEGKAAFEAYIDKIEKEGKL